MHWLPHRVHCRLDQPLVPLFARHLPCTRVEPPRCTPILRQEGQHSLLWVVDFPMFEWNEEEGRLEALHHPFTAPNPEDLAVRILLNASCGELVGVSRACKKHDMARVQTSA